MRELILILLGCVILHIIPYTSAKHHHHHHHHHHHKNHLIRKRSAPKVNRKAPVNSLVEDVSESTAFRDRAKKLRLVAESGEMYPVHTQAMAKRKSIPKKPRKKQEDSNDDSDDNDTKKKFRIEKGDDVDVEEDKNTDSDDDSNDDDESGSGDDGDNSDPADSNNDDNDDDKTASKGTKKCHRQCKAPLTFHQCAFPRCSEKLGTIKDLCFYLCKHQKQHCEDVCE